MNKPKPSPTVTAKSNTENVSADRVERTGKYFEERSYLLDNIRRGGGMSGMSSANSANLYGINHRNIPLATSRNLDHQGYTFFTRPDLRLSYDNLIQDRNLSLLLNDEIESIWRWVRAELSPRGSLKEYPSPFVDNKNPFIPILTNNLESISGWSEIAVDPWTSEAGAYNEQTSQVDGFADDYSASDMTCTFRNQVQDPINRLFHVWTRYSMLAHEGVVDPYIYNIVHNVLDYNTRIYRIVTDSSKQYIQHIAACGAAFPLNSNTAAKFDYSRERPYSDENDKVSIQFRIIGKIYDDPILFKEFNDLVRGYNPNMVDEKRDKHYKRIPANLLKTFNCLGLPHINLNNGRLDWYVSNQEYAFITNQVGAVIK